MSRLKTVNWVAVFGMGLLLASGSLAEQLPPLGATSLPPGKALNPDISLDGLLALSQFNRDTPLTFDGGHDPHFNGFNLQQIELSLNSNVDPYFRGDVNLVFTAEGVEVEEAYATTLDFPWGLQMKGGQFFTTFGRVNPTHPHTWDFVNKPLVLGRFFGGDGLRNPGAQLSWLTPLPWYSELIGSAQNTTGETANSFNPDGTMRSLKDMLFLGRWVNFFSLGDSLSLNLGGSYLSGLNASTDKRRMTRIYGGDLFLKFREPSGLSFLSLQAEALKRVYGTPVLDSTGNLKADHLDDWGWYAQLNYRLPEGWDRWHLGLRYDAVSAKNGVPVITTLGKDPLTGARLDLDSAKRYRLCPVLTFYPSEFSKVRLQYDFDKPDDFDKAQQVVTLQLEFLLGAHGAHKF